MRWHTQHHFSCLDERTSDASDRICPKLLKLHTPAGTLFARPSAWEQVRLQWMFRRFRCLSFATLTAPQRRLICVLSRHASVTPREEVARAEVIGTVTELDITREPTPVTLELPESAIPGQASGNSHVLTRSEKFVIEQIYCGPAHDCRRKGSFVPRFLPVTCTGSARDWAALSVIALVCLSCVLARVAGVLPRVVDHKPIGYISVDSPTNRPSGKAIPSDHDTATSLSLMPPAVQSRKRSHVMQLPHGRFVYPVSPEPVLVGWVTVIALISETGDVKGVTIVSGRAPLANAAASAIQHWRYLPEQLPGTVSPESNISLAFFGQHAVSIVLDAGD